jgi:hypothetical protein
LEFRNVDFYGGRKTGGPGGKKNRLVVSLAAFIRTKGQLNSVANHFEIVATNENEIFLNEFGLIQKRIVSNAVTRANSVYRA